MLQRTPQYAIPMNNPKLTDADRASYKKRFNELRHRVMRTFTGFDFDFMHGAFRTCRLRSDKRIWQKCGRRLVGLLGRLCSWSCSSIPQVNEEISAFVRDKIRRRIKDPALAKKSNT